MTELTELQARIAQELQDERACATLEALADFSARTQVILFTHHRRVVEQALALDRAGELGVCA